MNKKYIKEEGTSKFSFLFQKAKKVLGINSTIKIKNVGNESSDVEDIRSSFLLKQHIAKYGDGKRQFIRWPMANLTLIGKEEGTSKFSFLFQKAKKVLGINSTIKIKNVGNESSDVEDIRSSFLLKQHIAKYGDGKRQFIRWPMANLTLIGKEEGTSKFSFLFQKAKKVLGINSTIKIKNVGNESSDVEDIRSSFLLKQHIAKYGDGKRQFIRWPMGWSMAKLTLMEVGANNEIPVYRMQELSGEKGRRLTFIQELKFASVLFPKGILSYPDVSVPLIINHIKQYFENRRRFKKLLKEKGIKKSNLIPQQLRIIKQEIASYNDDTGAREYINVLIKKGILRIVAGSANVTPPVVNEGLKESREDAISKVEEIDTSMDGDTEEDSNQGKE